MYELLTLRHLTNRQSTPTRALAILVGIPPRPLTELLFDMRSAGLITSQVTLNLSDAKSEHSVSTAWAITPMGRVRLSDAIRRGVI